MNKHESKHAFEVAPSLITDLDFIFHLFEAAIEYQKKNNHELWPQFSRQLIKAEIKENRNWKLVNGKTIAAVFCVQYNDSIIWKEKDIEPSVYLHRIAVNPVFKGMGLMNVIRHWAIAHAKENNKMYVRMDTWGNNQKLRQYYINCGFGYLGQQFLDEVKESSAHYGGSVLSLFQIKV